MTETPTEAVRPRSPLWPRILFLVAFALAALNLIQLSRGLQAQWTCADEKRDLAAEQATTDRFHAMYYGNLNANWKNRWLGIPAQQNPNDIWVTQEILFEIKPDFVVEAGSYCGGSAVLWAMLLREINPKARVITIDIDDRTEEARRLPIFQERVDFLHGSSTAPEIVAEVKRRVAGHSVVLILDSDHRMQHVLNELRAYADIVPRGSYVIVQDTNINGHPVHVDPKVEGTYYVGQAGPYEAVQAFLAGNDRFQVDRSRERLMLTMNPGGFLRRVK